MDDTTDQRDFLKLAHRARLARLAGATHAPLALQSTLAAATGNCEGRRFLAAATDPAITGGAIGVAEALDLRRLIERARRENRALVLVIDSAGARVSEGVVIQGALRRLFAQLLAARTAGLITVAILGRNVFGGASMLAMLCETRLYAERTRLAMTGPAVLESRNGVSTHTVAKTVAGAHRLKCDRQGTSFTSAETAETPRLSELLQHALARNPLDYDTWLRAQGDDLGARLADEPAHEPAEAVQIVDPGTLKLCGSRSAGPDDVIQLVDALYAVPAERDRIVLDCEWAGHSIRLADEDRLLSQYLGHLCGVIHAIEARGTRICLHITGELSGGLYLALAAASSDVRLGAGARVLTLPSDVLETFVKMPATPEPGADTLIEHGVIDTIES